MQLSLIDGTYELFRAHFSKRPDHADPAGRPRKAVIGVVWSMLALLGDANEKVTHVGIAFDRPIRSFRNDLYPGYKSDEGVPVELAEQFVPVEDAMRALGLVVWSMDRWEADDALATAAARWSGDCDQVRILSPDKDLSQCLRDERVVQVDRVRQRVIDEAALRANRGIAPASVPDYLALVGDTADGIPGVPGFGPKSTAALLGRYGHIERIPTRASDWDVAVRGAESLAASLAAHREDAFLYRHLATLVTDVPLPESLDELRWRGVPQDAFCAWCDSVGAGDSLRSMGRRASSPSHTGDAGA